MAAIASWNLPRRASQVGLSGEKHRAMNASVGSTIESRATARHDSAPPNAYTYSTPKE